MGINSQFMRRSVRAVARVFQDRDRLFGGRQLQSAVNYKLFEKICLPNGEEGVMLPGHSILSSRDIQRVQPRRLIGKGKGFPLLSRPRLTLSEK